MNIKDNKLLTQKLRQKLEDKQTKKAAAERQEKIYVIMQGVAKNISLSTELEIIRLYNIRFSNEFAEFLSEGLKNNTSISSLFINYCDLVSESSDIILRGLIEHPKIEILDFSNNFLDDKTGYMVSRLISRQNERRDETVWKYGLRNEKPYNSDYKRGLVLINFSDNFLSENSADVISTAMQNDTYLRSLNLSRNQILLEGCKKLIRAMRKNFTLISLDLRQNYGYNENVHKRILVKISRNIKNQFKSLSEDALDSSKENEYLKQFINYEFFNFEIPHEFVERYNNIVENEQIGLNRYNPNNNNFNSNNNNNLLNPFSSFGIPNFNANNLDSNKNLNLNINTNSGHNFHFSRPSDNISTSNKLTGNINSEAEIYSNNYYSNKNNFTTNPEQTGNLNGNNSNNVNNLNNHNNRNLKERKYSLGKESDNNVINHNNNLLQYHTTKNSHLNKQKNSFDLNANARNTSNKKVIQKLNKIPNNPDKKTRASSNISNPIVPNSNKNKHSKNLSLKDPNKKLLNNNNNKSADGGVAGNSNIQSGANSTSNNQAKKQSKSKSNLEERRFEYKVEKTQKNDNKSKSEDIQFELDADNEYDKIINEENDNDDDFIFRNYSDGEIFARNEITTFNNLSLPQNNLTNLDIFPAKDSNNNNRNSVEFKYNKKANKYFEKFKYCRCSQNFRKIYDKIHQKNKLLFVENLKLRRQLITMRAINISMNQNQQRLNNNNICNQPCCLLY